MERMIKLIVLLAALSPLAIAAPTPTPSLVAWQMDCMVPDSLKPIRLMIGDDETAQTFWYLRILVTNKTGEDIDFIPDVDLVTNTGEIHPNDQDVPVAVFSQVKSLYNQPLLMDLTDATGKVLQGDDNAKAILLLFSDFDPAAGQADVYITGLSGETEVVKLPEPVTKTRVTVDGEEVTETVEAVILRKTLKLTYQLPGSVEARLEEGATLLSQEWVMR
jgi:hypothetical protein